MADPTNGGPSLDRRLPTWVIEEIVAWLDDAKTGVLGLEFRDGQPIGIERNEKVRPQASANKRVPCPTCERPMRCWDYGAKYTCDPCDLTFSAWELRRRGVKV